MSIENFTIQKKLGTFNYLSSILFRWRII